MKQEQAGLIVFSLLILAGILIIIAPAASVLLMISAVVITIKADLINYRGEK